MSASFRRMASVTASTKRPPAVNLTTGQRGEPELHLPSLHCTPLDPAESQKARDLAFRLQQENGRMYELLQSFTEATNDIREGDVVVVNGKEYPVRSVGTWLWRGSSYLELLLEEPKP
jgi:hypothetical protein